MSVPDSARPVVGVWHDAWLAPSETFIRDQVQAMERYRPVLLGLTQLDNSILAADFAPYSTARTPGPLRHPLESWRYRSRYRSAFAEHGVRLLHAHFGTCGVTAAAHARAAGVPLAVTFHGRDATVVPRHPAARARHLLRLQRLFRSADTLIAVSDFIAECLQRLGAPQDKIVVHRIGIALPSGPGVHPGPRDGIVFVGRLVEKKGLSDLLDAVDRLPEPLRRTPVRVIGYGPLLEPMRDKARALGLEVDFLGRRTSAEVAAVLQRSAVLCVPSQQASNGDSEGFGMVFLEAASWGTPSVSYRHGGVPEAVLADTTGLLADEGDVAGLSERLAQVLGDPALASTLGEAARSRAVRDFDIRERTRELETIYDRILRGRP